MLEPVIQAGTRKIFRFKDLFRRIKCLCHKSFVIVYNFYVLKKAAKTNGIISAEATIQAYACIPFAGTHPVKIMILDRKSTRLNSSHLVISYAVFCLKK